MTIQIENIQVEDLDHLTPDELNNQQVIIQIEKIAADPMYNYEPGLAREFYDLLAKLLENSKAIRNQNISARLLVVLSTLEWQSLQNQTKKIKERILVRNVIPSIKKQIDIVYCLERYLRMFELGIGPDAGERQMFIDALIRNQEILGPQALILKSGDKVIGSIANWLKDYISYSDPAKLRTGTYEMTQYFYSSPNVKTLSMADRQLLTNILTVYNHLKYPKNIPVVERTPQSSILRPTPPVPTSPKIAFPIISKPPIPHGAPLEEFKAKMQAGTVKFPPKPQPAISMTPQEIQREVKTVELPGHKSEIASRPSTAVLSQMAARKDETRPPHSASSPRMSVIQTIDDLKKLDLSFLRQGSLQSQISNLKSLISNLARANNVLPYYAVTAFEQSPLFKSYMAHGNSKVVGSGAAGEMTQAEFEAMADLRKEIERL